MTEPRSSTSPRPQGPGWTTWASSSHGSATTWRVAGLRRLRHGPLDPGPRLAGQQGQPGGARPGIPGLLHLVTEPDTEQAADDRGVGNALRQLDRGGPGGLL